MLNLLSRQRSDAGLGPRRRCARGAAAWIISTYAKGAASSLACLLAAGTDGAGMGKKSSLTRRSRRARRRKRTSTRPENRVR